MQANVVKGGNDVNFEAWSGDLEVAATEAQYLVGSGYGCTEPKSSIRKDSEVSFLVKMFPFASGRKKPREE